MDTLAASPAMSRLSRLTDDTGLFEHCWYATPRRDEGYCTDDNGRALALVCLIGGSEAARLAETYLAFLHHAHLGAGHFHIRMGFDRRWKPDEASDDASGRAILGLGTAATDGPEQHIRDDAAALFELACPFRSRYWRATAAAVGGASAFLAGHPGHDGAMSLIREAADSLPRRVANADWPWPEKRLGYETARLPLALFHVGTALEDEATIDEAVLLLRWLIKQQLRDTHLSLVPATGRNQHTHGPGFDQQPLEAWALAEAALAGMQIAPCELFETAIELAAAWFDGSNDVGVSMVDPSTGGAFDGLEAHDVNRNQGAESLLALLGTRHVCERLSRLSPRTGVA
jgi:hypothetical protein